MKFYTLHHSFLQKICEMSLQRRLESTLLTCLWNVTLHKELHGFSCAEMIAHEKSLTRKKWCGREELNFHFPEETATSTLRVYHSATTANEF